MEIGDSENIGAPQIPVVIWAIGNRDAARGAGGLSLWRISREGGRAAYMAPGPPSVVGRKGAPGLTAEPRREWPVPNGGCGNFPFGAAA